MNDRNTTTKTNYTNWNAVLLAGLASGTADFVYASTRALMAGKSVLGPWKGVAGGLIGPAAREGAIGTAALGVALHFFICMAAAAMFHQILRRLPWFAQRWWLTGILYGIAFLAVMNWIVLPLSQIGRPIYGWDDMHMHVFWHVVLVGWPTAWFLRQK
jgi:hypothetical protein